ncbi:hypothetical protein S23_37810 [Bradyrhizobium cosmicum]|uniref:Uncharacterized protein n=1 Tax=Bradyrhizobium cosmicum TaxID=1404864 RepID=A0AAI8MBD3_9BRAD|nr:hypothetical protein S23_37810 [Bradyrhizobium cosmicum]
MVLVEPPPPPEPELPSADCEDEAADVSEVADVDDATEDDVVAVGWDVEAVTAALDDAIALIDMKASLAGKPRASRRSRARLSLQRGG